MYKVPEIKLRENPGYFNHIEINDQLVLSDDPLLLKENISTDNLFNVKSINHQSKSIEIFDYYRTNSFTVSLEELKNPQWTLFPTMGVAKFYRLNIH